MWRAGSWPLLVVMALAQADASGMRVGEFAAEVRTAFAAADGLPDSAVLTIAVMPAGEVYAGTGNGLARFAMGTWTAVPGFAGAPVESLAVRGSELLLTFRGALHRLADGRASAVAALPRADVRGLAAGSAVLLATGKGLFELRGKGWTALREPGEDIRQVAVASDGRTAVAAHSGLFLRESAGRWRPLYPREGATSWAPRDVRGVAYDSHGRLWFASPQGAGRFDGAWRLYTGHEELPYDDFTTLAPGENGIVWFGTKKGAIRFDGKTWEYRQGLRWLPDDDVRAIAATREGHAWFATPRGAAVIERRPITLGLKAAYFEQEIDKRHRRTPLGYVLSVSLKRPGDTSEWTQHDSDNDGLWTGMYGAGECFAYAATKDPAAKRRARAAFEALRFLGTVTQGGSPPAPPGFVARAVLPSNGPNPNEKNYTREKDEAFRATRDRLWKVLVPRWPLSADGKWYWKTDTSSDELDGHYFFYARYFDLVAETEQEKREVGEVVRSITDHLITNDYSLVDWDGKPTRWGVFGPRDLNGDPKWWVERGLNSLSILSYLSVAEHVTGDGRYRRAAEKLVRDHSYDINLMVPKIASGIGTGNQSDDEMAFMSFYNLVRYETDPSRKKLYCLSFSRYWEIERMELNPLFDFLYAASCSGVTYTDAFRTTDLTPKGAWLEDAVDTLKRYPMDRISWRMENRHRKDLILLAGGERGYRRNGKVLPIDERFVEHWNHDPFRLDQGGNGTLLADGASFLLPYYLGLHHGYLAE